MNTQRNTAHLECHGREGNVFIQISFSFYLINNLNENPGLEPLAPRVLCRVPGAIAAEVGITTH